MWIKICGNTTVKDAGFAVDAAADAVGFVFAASPRQVQPAQVASITAELPMDLTHVGVFHTQEFSEIVAATRTAGLNGIQLHGGLNLKLLEDLRREVGDRQFLIQTLHWFVDGDPVESESKLREEIRKLDRHNVADAILLDAKTATAAGGTGRTIDWTRTRDAIAAESGKMRIILAGGLNPQNVGEAIHTVKPWGVDVSSGVEREPGRKDAARVRAFILNARTAFAAIENDPLATLAPR
jgi:phosphoribosylanthranilate isomerase